MAISLYAVNQGYLDEVEVAKVQAFEQALQSFMKQKHPALLDEINQKPDYTDDVAANLKRAIEEFKATHTW
jgi:F-type H+-transporting ATPase subunit alpha